jgi:hypothetical protein
MSDRTISKEETEELLLYDGSKGERAKRLKAMELSGDLVWREDIKKTIFDAIDSIPPAESHDVFIHYPNDPLIWDLHERIRIKDERIKELEKKVGKL